MVVTKCDKIGRNLGFCSLEVRRRKDINSSEGFSGGKSSTAGGDTSLADASDDVYHDDVLGSWLPRKVPDHGHPLGCAFTPSCFPYCMDDLHLLLQE